ncbi:MAG: hypothetical protein JWP06_679 [Candidatus Saccharibacteria bacterium]|nr:hypothetical protein [Candidatus Saccharibacteria bacterium]
MLSEIKHYLTIGVCLVIVISNRLTYLELDDETPIPYPFGIVLFLPPKYIAVVE